MRTVYLFLFLATFLTGSSGLIYQVVWQRYLSRLLGADTFATAIILGVFLGGLSLGYFLCGKLSLYVRDHIKVYALLEAIIGLWGIGFGLVYPIVYNATLHWAFQPPWQMLGQGLFVCLALMGPATVMMGGTVPLLTRGISARLEMATKMHAWLYATNTAGAFLGTLVAGFLLIEWLGLYGALYTAAGVNFLVAGIFFQIGKKCPTPEEDLGEEVAAVETVPVESAVQANAERSPVTPAPSPLPASVSQSVYNPWQLCLIAFLSGFYVMTLENVLIRVLSISMGSISYNFSIIVAVFILCIALGSGWIGFVRKIPSRMLFVNQALIAVFLLPVFWTLDAWPYYGHIFKITFFPSMSGFVANEIALFLALLGLLFIPVCLMGATVPIAFHEIKRSLGRVGEHSGILLGSNGFGSLVGSIMGGLLLFIPFEIGTVFMITALLAALACLVAALSLHFRYKVAAAVVLLLVLVFTLLQPGYNNTYFARGFFRHNTVSPVSYKGNDAFQAFVQADGKVLSCKTYPEATIAIKEFPDPDSKGRKPLALLANGRSESATHPADMACMLLSAHIPALFCQEPESILTIGMGTGATAGAFTLYPQIEHIAVGELHRSIIDLLPLFGEFTHNVHEDQRLEVLHGDARRILRADQQKWDIITSEPSNLYVIGVDQLFSYEFFQLVKSRLADGGRFLQWIQGYQLAPETLSLVLNSLAATFSNIYVFDLGGDILILSSNKPLGEQDVSLARARLESLPDVKEDLNYVGIGGIDDVLGRVIAAPLALATDRMDDGYETETHPRIHYMGARDLYCVNEPVLSVVKAKYGNSPVTRALEERYRRNWLRTNPVDILSPLDIQTMLQNE